MEPRQNLKNLPSWNHVDFWLGFKILSRDTGSHQKVNTKISHILGCCGKTHALQMGKGLKQVQKTKKNIQLSAVQTTKHQSSSVVQIGTHLREPDARIHNALISQVLSKQTAWPYAKGIISWVRPPWLPQHAQPRPSLWPVISHSIRSNQIQWDSKDSKYKKDLFQNYCIL